MVKFSPVRVVSIGKGIQTLEKPPLLVYSSQTAEQLVEKGFRKLSCLYQTLQILGTLGSEKNFCDGKLSAETCQSEYKCCLKISIIQIKLETNSRLLFFQGFGIAPHAQVKYVNYDQKT